MISRLLYKLKVYESLAKRVNPDSQYAEARGVLVGPQDMLRLVFSLRIAVDALGGIRSGYGQRGYVPSEGNDCAERADKAFSDITALYAEENIK